MFKIPKYFNFFEGILARCIKKLLHTAKPSCVNVTFVWCVIGKKYSMVNCYSKSKNLTLYLLLRKECQNASLSLGTIFWVGNLSLSELFNIIRDFKNKASTPPPPMKAGRTVNIKYVHFSICILKRGRVYNII